MSAANSDKAGKELEQVKEDLGALREDIRALTAALADLGKQRVEEASDKISDRKDEVLESFSLSEIRERLEALKGEGEEAVDVVRQQVEKNPVGTLLVTLGVGVLLGKLLSSSR